LEYEFRSWDDLKRFVEHVQKTDAKTEQELNIATVKSWHDGLANREWRNYLVRPDHVVHFNEQARAWNEVSRVSPPQANFDAGYVLDNVVADGDKVTARDTWHVLQSDGTRKKVSSIHTWRLVAGRFAESWAPQDWDTIGDHSAPPGTRPAMTRLDEGFAASPDVQEINYVNFLLHHLARSAPASVTIREGEALPEVQKPETGMVIKTCHEHVFLRLRTMTQETTRIHVREQGHDFVARVSFADEPEETCRIDVEPYAPDKTR